MKLYRIETTGPDMYVEACDVIHAAEIWLEHKEKDDPRTRCANIKGVHLVSEYGVLRDTGEDEQPEGAGQ